MEKVNEKKAVVKRSFTGTVVSAAMAKTVVARVDTMRLNRKYDKRVKVSAKYHVHDEKGEAQVGDKIRFAECRPLSRTKRWRLIEVVK